jgi:hypothetical protein
MTTIQRTQSPDAQIDCDQKPGRGEKTGLLLLPQIPEPLPAVHQSTKRSNAARSMLRKAFALFIVNLLIQQLRQGVKRYVSLNAIDAALTIKEATHTSPERLGKRINFTIIIVIADNSLPIARPLIRPGEGRPGLTRSSPGTNELRRLNHLNEAEL